MKRKVLIITALILLITSTVCIAETEDLSSLNEAIKSQSNIFSVLSGTSEDILIGMSKSFFDLVRYIAITYITTRLFLLHKSLGEGGDNPQLLASVKSKALWHVLGLLFSLNFWSIVKFSMDIANKLNFL